MITTFTSKFNNLTYKIDITTLNNQVWLNIVSSDKTYWADYLKMWVEAFNKGYTAQLPNDVISFILKLNKNATFI